VELLGGTISFVSTVGAGSRFSFNHPLVVADPDAVEQPARVALGSGSERSFRILLAEDNRVDQRMMTGGQEAKAGTLLKGQEAGMTPALPYDPEVPLRPDECPPCVKFSVHCCPGDEFWIPGNHLTGRGLAGVFAFPDLNCFRADVAQKRPSASGTHHRQ
jgi:hypothetical protein